VVEIVFDGSIRSSFDQQLHHRHVSRLSGHGECGNALTVRQPTDGTFLVDVGAVIQQPCRCLAAVARCVPNQRSTSTGVGIEPRAGSYQAPQNAYAIALARPHQCIVEYLLRISRELPIREPAVRAIEATGGAALRCQRAVAAKASLHQFEDPQPGRSVKIVWGYCTASQQIGDLAMSPEQRSDQSINGADSACFASSLLCAVDRRNKITIARVDPMDRVLNAIPANNS
jgi:hypothetical protein